MARPRVAIGDLRHAVTVQRKTTSPNAAGDLVGSWSAVASGLPASITPTKGGEEVRASRLSGISHFDIVVRSSTASRSITPADRLIDREGQTYNVRWSGSLDGGRYIWIAAEAGGLE